jgi:hypothetical protein
MNERIQELATEVGISVEYLTNTKQWTLIEALALLIVQECAEVCASIAAVRAGYNDADGRDTADSCGDQIKEHFGVE